MLTILVFFAVFKALTTEVYFWDAHFPTTSVSGYVVGWVNTPCLQGCLAVLRPSRPKLIFGLLIYLVHLSVNLWLNVCAPSLVRAAL